MPFAIIRYNAAFLLCLLFLIKAVNAQTVIKHRVIGQDKNHLAIISADGNVEWETPCAGTVHDLSVLPNGNILFQPNVTTTVEMSPDKKIVWQYVSKPKEGYSGAVEVHSYQRLANGNTMIAESGNQRIIEVAPNGNIIKEIHLTVDHPHYHHDTRIVRKLNNGHYLVCHETDATVREYDENGTVVWSYTLDLNNRKATEGHEGHGTDVFGALRLNNGNTLIAGGSNNRVIEVNNAGKIVWGIDYNELPGITLFWVTSLQILPNGHIVFGNTHAGDSNPQLIEVTHDKEKKVVWALNNHTVFGNNMAVAQVLDAN